MDYLREMPMPQREISNKVKNQVSIDNFFPKVKEFLQIKSKVDGKQNIAERLASDAILELVSEDGYYTITETNQVDPDIRELYRTNHFSVDHVNNKSCQDNYNNFTEYMLAKLQDPKKITHLLKYLIAVEFRYKEENEQFRNASLAQSVVRSALKLDASYLDTVVISILYHFPKLTDQGLIYMVKFGFQREIDLQKIQELRQQQKDLGTAIQPKAFIPLDSSISVQQSAQPTLLKTTGLSSEQQLTLSNQNDNEHGLQVLATALLDEDVLQLNMAIEKLLQQYEKLNENHRPKKALAKIAIEKLSLIAHTKSCSLRTLYFIIEQIVGYDKALANGNELATHTINISLEPKAIYDFFYNDTEQQFTQGLLNKALKRLQIEQKEMSYLSSLLSNTYVSALFKPVSQENSVSTQQNTDPTLQQTLILIDKYLQKMLTDDIKQTSSRLDIERLSKLDTRQQLIRGLLDSKEVNANSNTSQTKFNL
jgi:hypothetical protein